MIRVRQQAGKGATNIAGQNNGPKATKVSQRRGTNPSSNRGRPIQTQMVPPEPAGGGRPPGQTPIRGTTTQPSFTKVQMLPGLRFGERGTQGGRGTPSGTGGEIVRGSSSGRGDGSTQRTRNGESNGAGRSLQNTENNAATGNTQATQSTSTTAATNGQAASSAEDNLILGEDVSYKSDGTRAVAGGYFQKTARKRNNGNGNGANNGSTGPLTDQQIAQKHEHETQSLIAQQAQEVLKNAKRDNPLSEAALKDKHEKELADLKVKQAKDIPARDFRLQQIAEDKRNFITAWENGLIPNTKIGGTAWGSQAKTTDEAAQEILRETNAIGGRFGGFGAR